MQPGIDFFISFTTIKFPDFTFFISRGCMATYVGGLIREKSSKQTVYSSLLIPSIFNDIIHELSLLISAMCFLVLLLIFVNSVCLKVVCFP
ncbi:hypothetical protein ACX52_4370 [Yersinia pestis]|nr:hypothetical protein ACX52_4370 [Yersinia pestis]